METDRKIERDVPNLLVKYRREVEEAARQAVRDALLRHKQEGNPVAVSIEGKVVLLKPEEIDV